MSIAPKVIEAVKAELTLQERSLINWKRELELMEEWLTDNPELNDVMYAAWVWQYNNPNKRRK